MKWRKNGAPTGASCLGTSCVLVTKGDVDLSPILEGLPFEDVVIWDNSKRECDLKVYGRYAAISEAKHSVIYTQDDDCVVDAEGVVSAYEPGYLVCNMPPAKRREYEVLAPEIALVGWGACFDRDALHAFARYRNQYELDELFYRECDRVFTALNPQKQIDVPFSHLSHAGIGRMGNEPRHLNDLAEIRRRILSVKRSPAVDSIPTIR